LEHTLPFLQNLQITGSKTSETLSMTKEINGNT
jgi:hypothetical protein